MHANMRSGEWNVCPSLLGGDLLARGSIFGSCSARSCTSFLGLVVVRPGPTNE